MDEEKQKRVVGAIVFGVSFVLMWKICAALFIAYTPLSISPIAADSLAAAIGAGIALTITNKWFPNTFKRK